eukprot:TRINITY_DN8642_c0_g1_i3.p1 TRINITY_DN8642_c0_g1~~TRINITY_DN8642_c0_g1_i3.p1  ORF type:complete len:225 (-),score=28.05 TRINITY_DN8642_c0_g1_i3:30-704(-)
MKNTTIITGPQNIYSLMVLLSEEESFKAALLSITQKKSAERITFRFIIHLIRQITSQFSDIYKLLIEIKGFQTKWSMSTMTITQDEVKDDHRKSVKAKSILRNTTDLAMFLVRILRNLLPSFMLKGKREQIFLRLNTIFSNWSTKMTALMKGFDFDQLMEHLIQAYVLAFEERRELDSININCLLEEHPIEAEAHSDTESVQSTNSVTEPVSYTHLTLPTIYSV